MPWQTVVAAGVVGAIAVAVVYHAGAEYERQDREIRELRKQLYKLEDEKFWREAKRQVENLGR